MGAPYWVAEIDPAPQADQSASVTFPKPGAGLLQDGDVLCVPLRSQGTRNGEIVLPTGWFRGGPGTVPNDRVQGQFYKPIPSVAAESATSYTFGGLSTSTSRVIGKMRVMRGADLTHLNDGGIGYDTDATLPASAAGGAPYMISAQWGAEFTAGVSVVPSGMPAGLTTDLVVQTAGGTSPSSVLANSNTTGSRTGMILASRRVESGDTAVASIAATWAGAPTDPKSSLWIVRGKVDAAPPAGFTSVQEMMTKRGATWAHRGGSASYTEHSLYAYAQAAARGYGALELSMQRTVDGVWFGCHDLDLARVTGNPALTQDVRTMTWAQVNSYQMTVGASGAPQPFMRWQDFIAAGYGNTHVLILDPKNSVGTHQAEFLAMVAADVAKERVLMKWAGGLTSFADAAKAAGFQTAGYWYQADYTNGNLAAESTHWDWLGMDIGATTAWSGVGNIVELAAAQGKKVWGHIAANQTEYNTAMTKGANVVQSAAVATIAAVGPAAPSETNAPSSGSGALSATTQAVPIAENSAAFTGAGSLSVAVEVIADQAATLTGSGMLSAETSISTQGDAAFSGAGALTAAVEATSEAVIDAQFGAGGMLSAVAEIAAAVDAVFAAAGSLTAMIETASEVSVSAPFAGVGALSTAAPSEVVAAGDASFSGGGALSAIAERVEAPEVAAAFSGAGILGLAVTVVAEVAVTLSALGTLTASAYMVSEGVTYLGDDLVEMRLGDTPVVLAVG